MAKNKKKLSSKAVTRQKKQHRQWVTFLRMCRYGVNNFTRNAWLTVAATAIMTITLFVIFVSLVSQHVLQNTLAQLRDSVSMSIFLKTETSPEDAERAASEVRALSSVNEVTISSPDDARETFIRERSNDASALDAATQATNKLPWTLKIKVKDINDTAQLSDVTANNGVVKEFIDENRPPSFAGERRETIETIGAAATFAQQLGIIVSVVFASISMLIIFNTIRMAIFNRREEIQMMKLIGAEKSFIRGPFLVEAIVYGFFAAIIATVLGVGLVILVAPAVEAVGIVMQSTLNYVIYYVGFVLLGMIIVGSIIGIISSLLATRRYLKL